MGRFIARALVALAFLVALTSSWGCTSQDHWLAAGASTRVVGGTTNGSLSFRKQNVEADSTYIGLEITPFEYWHMKMQAEAMARAATEAAYREKMGVDSTKPEAEKPK